MLRSTDLFRHGYSVVHWLRLTPPRDEVLEYLPRLSDLPRLTAGCWAEQAEIHRALGLRVVGPGERYVDLRGQLELFPYGEGVA